jgi:hypothetical protein
MSRLAKQLIGHFKFLDELENHLKLCVLSVTK